MVVLGHSGTTGYNSDPAQPRMDARANSWATGTNPAVHSIYQRLLATHPALRGHATSLGVDGSDVHDLAAQVDEMFAEVTPMPDLVIVQSIDNDMQCDGTDAENEKTFAARLTTVLDAIYARDPSVDIYFVDQPVSVRNWTEAIKDIQGAQADQIGVGPCQTLSAPGKERPAGIASEQAIVDGYFARITTVCMAHPHCWTDNGQLQRMPITPTQITPPDYNHLTLAGLANEAAYAWTALPDSIKHHP